VEGYLETQSNEIKELEKKILFEAAQKEKLPARKEKLKSIDIEVNDEELLKIDDNQFDALFNDFYKKHLEVQAEKLRLENERIAAEKAEEERIKREEEERLAEEDKSRIEAENAKLKAEAEAKEKALAEDMIRLGQTPAIRHLTQSYWNRLNIDQQGALVSFVYNCGTGSPTFRIFRNIQLWLDKKKTSKALADYWANSVIRASGRVQPGLVRRRQTEAVLFLTGKLQFTHTANWNTF
jgi:GH24 family phage-related lysozyme (muramidase)